MVGLVLEEDDISDTVLESQRLAVHQTAKGNVASTFTRRSIIRVKVHNIRLAFLRVRFILPQRCTE